jgi:peroxiredoxin
MYTDAVKWRGISTDTAEQAQPNKPLSERLLEVRAGIAQYVRPENQQINERTVEWLRASGMGNRAQTIANDLSSRAKAQPQSRDLGFSLPDQHGRIVSSADLFIRGSLVITFFRGRWCPFCIAELEAWRDALPQVKAAGASLVAISPQKVQHNAFTADQHKLGFAVLSDAGNQIARRFGIVYRVPEEQEQLYRRSFVNLPHLNGDDSWELPLAATFGITPDGAIKFAFIPADYRERAEPSAVIASLIAAG